MSKEDNLQNRTLTIKRTFNAPVKLVWEAWTNPEHIAKWWGPKGMETTVVKHEFKVGGKWEYRMKMSDGNNFITEGTYSQIETLKKICSSADFKPMTEDVEIQAFFEDNGEKTNFIFNCIHKTEAYCKQQEEMGFYNGWGSTFERLDSFVSKT